MYNLERLWYNFWDFIDDVGNVSFMMLQPEFKARERILKNELPYYIHRAGYQRPEKYISEIWLNQDNYIQD